MTIIGALFAFVGLALTYYYDRGRRYNYLADRWNDLMNISLDEPDFFDAEMTDDYKAFDKPKRIKYDQHARRYWGMVEDVIRNDYLFERNLSWLGLESFLDAYRDTIRDCIRLHYAWLQDNKERLFSYRKFREELNKNFQRELAAVKLDFSAGIPQSA